jgi:hypothetical protein
MFRIIMSFRIVSFRIVTYRTNTWCHNKWPVRPLRGELQCRGLRPLCEGLELGGSSVEEGVGQSA